MEKVMHRLWDITKQAAKPRWPWQSNQTPDDEGLTYASVTGRLFALAIDFTLITIPLAPILPWVLNQVFDPQTLLMETQQLAMMTQQVQTGQMPMDTLLRAAAGSQLVQHTLWQWMLAIGAYGALSIYMQARWGWTPGMWLFRYRLRHEDKQRLVGCGRLSWRYILALLTAGVGYLWVPLTKQHQALHDKYSDTVMIKLPLKRPTPKEEQPED